jgi:hypothetical protein
MRSLPAALCVLTLLLLPASCGGDLPMASSSTGTQSESDGVGVSGGGYLVATGRPTLLYGTLLEGDRRTFTYLVIARGMAPDDWSVEQDWQGTSTASGDELDSRHSLGVDGRRMEAWFHARVEGGRAVDRELEVCGATLPAEQWLLLYDARRPSQGIRPHEATMPDLPIALEDLEPAVEAYVEQLVAQDPEIATFLEG